MYLLFKSDIVQTLREKTDEGEAESTIFILVLSSFLSVKSLLKIWSTTFPFSLLKVLSLLCLSKMVIRLVFLSFSIIRTVKYCQKLAIFKFLFLSHVFVILHSLLSSCPFPTRLLFLIVLHKMM